MAYKVTDRARALFSQAEITPNLIVEIEGYPNIFTADISKTVAKFGENDIYFGQPGLTFGGLIEILNQRNLISLSGTSTEITQQLEPDQGNVSSIQKLNVRLVDLNEEATRLISPSFVFEDILYKFCKLYLGPAQGSFPQDYIELFNGNIQGVKAGSGFVDIEVAHPEDVRRAKIFTKAESILQSPLHFNSANIQSLIFRAFNFVTGVVRVQITTGAAPLTANVMVAGQDITIEINAGTTQIKTIKKEIENNSNANQLVSVSYADSNDQNNLALVTGGYITLSSSTTIELDDVTQFLEPVSPLFKTYVQIGDEIIEYASIDLVNKQLLGCTRTQLNTFGEYHDAGATVSSFYKLGDGTQANGNAVDLALKVYLSGPEANYLEGVIPLGLGSYGLSQIPNAIYFKNLDLEREFGVTAGDLITITGASNPGNNQVDLEVLEVLQGNGFSYLVTSQNFDLETPTLAQISFKSQYNVLPDGLGLKPVQVDIVRFLELKRLYFSSIALYEIYLKDTISASEFISKQLYLPSALFSVPRRGRISLGFTAAPLFNQNTKSLDINTVKRADSLVINRSITKNFYNAVVYKYDRDSLEDKYLRGRIEISQNSVNRIKIPNQPLLIQSDGLRDAPTTALLLKRNATRFLQRYQYGAESLDVEVPFSIGWDVEVGDPIVLGGSDLQLSDSKTGNRSFRPRIFEITNKRFNWRTGQIRLTLTDSSFNLQIRYGVFSPASKIVSGTTSTILIQNSYGTQGKERDKWQFYVGRQVKVTSNDFTQSEVTTLLGFSASNDFEMLIEPISFAAPVGGYVRLPNYDEITSNNSQVLKDIHPFFTPQDEVTAVVSDKKFEVLDVSKFFVGAVVRIHSNDYGFDSGVDSFEVESIAGNEITLKTEIPGVSVGDKISLIGFVSDSGAPYAWI